MSQLATPLGGRGKKFRVNLTQNLKVEGRKVAEWCRLVGKEDKIAQVAQFSKVGAGRGNKGGESEAARQLGLSQPDVHRASKVASITPEAQQAAHEVGNRWATKSKQLLASASPWVQLVDSWWTAGGHLVDSWWTSGGQALFLPGKGASHE